MKNFKSLKFILTTLLLVFVFAFSAFAGTAVIQFGDPKVTRDKVFSVSCKIKSTDVRIKSADITVQYDPNMIEFMEGTNAEGGAGTVRMSGTGFGNTSGTRTLEFQLKLKTGSSKVTINPSNTQSKNANLSKLEFSPGELDREFDASVLSYNTEVNADVDSLALSAIAEDKDARVVITGNENFQTGMNKVTIDVTAPDGKTKKQYVINVTKFENGVTNGTTTIANGQRFSSKAYGPNNTPDGETPEVFLVYGMNQEGVTDFYRYDSRGGDNTIQRYVPEPNAGDYEGLLNQYNALKEKSDETSKRFGIIFPVTIILAALVLLLIIIMIILIVRGSSNKKSSVDELEDDDDDDYFSSKPRRLTSSNDRNANDELDDDYDLNTKKETFDDKFDDKFNNDVNDDVEAEIEDLG